ncbi:response regulator [Winogradskyella helgolandensis]|uniref:response regulator n=1 Tax=Winogradskyella helgolandensis TaxID=2697010 RepID=UPI0015C94A67|nr:response regulator [Winogradskyella helgolandensis]
MMTSILLVDDDEDDRLFFEEAIEELNEDISFKSLNNGLEALTYLETCTTLPHAIFLDINMPIVDGPKCLKRLRADANYDGIVIFMYSTSSVPDTITQLQKAGANFYIRKPISFNALKLLIKKSLDLLPQLATAGQEENNFFITNDSA